MLLVVIENTLGVKHTATRTKLNDGCSVCFHYKIASTAELIWGVEKENCSDSSRRSWRWPTPGGQRTSDAAAGSRIELPQRLTLSFMHDLIFPIQLHTFPTQVHTFFLHVVTCILDVHKKETYEVDFHK